MTRTTEPGKGLNIALWILQILLAVAFFMAGGAKLSGAPAMVQVFDKIGLGQWFRYLTGIVEVGSALLLLIPGFAGLGALLLVCTMVGAVISHLTILGGSPAAPLGLLLLSAVVAWFRRGQIARLLGR